jgi:hypothetical protein
MKNSRTPCPITINDILIHEMKPVGNHLYDWESDMGSNQNVQVRIRLNRSGAFIESYSVSNMSEQSSS